MAADIVIRFVGDASQAIAVTKQVEDAHKSMAQSLIRTGAALTAGVTLPIVAMGAVAFKEFEEAGKVAAQTNAVLRSTGEIAGVSAKQVDTLAQSMLHKTGIDDEAIKSGENMLLTFTNIRNEAGKGNDVFTQATKITADLSVAFGKDMTDAAVLVGKALQDPIAGVTALQRVGVQLSATQKQQIKDFVAVGDVASAEKVILAELTTQVGGSANAFGQTMAGQLAIAKQEMLNAGAAIIMVLAPSLKVLAEVAQAVAGAIQSLPQGLQVVIGVLALLAAAVGPATTAIGGLMKLIEILPKVGSAFVSAGLNVAAFVENIGGLGVAGPAALLALGLLAAYFLRVKTATEEAADAGKKHAEAMVENIQTGSTAGVALDTLVAKQTILTAQLSEARDAQDAYKLAANNSTDANRAHGVSAVEASTKSHDFGVQVADLEAQHQVYAAAIEKATREQKLAKIADDARQQSLANLTAGTQQSTQATLDAINAMQQYANTVLAAQGGSVGLEAAQINLQTAQQKLTDLENSGTATALELAAAHNQVDQATLGVANAAVTSTAKQDAFNATLNQDSLPALEATKKALEDAKAAHGDNTGAIQLEIDKINGYIATAQGIPPQASTRAEFDSQEAERRMADYKRQIDELPEVKRIQVIAAIGAAMAGGAQGGIVRRPTVAMIGEAGPEALIPLHRMPGVSALGATRGLAGLGAGGGHQTFNINIEVAQGVNPAQVGAATVDAIRAYERLNGKSWRN